MPEFANPKYKDKGRTVFNTPARLECMMQVRPLQLRTFNSQFQERFSQASSLLTVHSLLLLLLLQDFPRNLPSDAPVGYTLFDRWMIFSAIKNKVCSASCNLAMFAYKSPPSPTRFSNSPPVVRGQGAAVVDGLRRDGVDR